MLEDEPGALARMGEALGCAGVSIEGGGAAVVDGSGIGHFLFQDGEAARTALEAKGIRVLTTSDVLVQKVNQDEPGQLGRLTCKIADAGVNIKLLYTDHEHQLILVVDDQERGSRVSQEWEAQRKARQTSGLPQVRTHSYQIQTQWSSSGIDEKVSYSSYSRNHSIQAIGKPPIEASSDPAFRGDVLRYNPEELLVSSLSSCHMLWYLHLCAMAGIKVLRYADEATGQMDENPDGSGVFKEVTLNPKVTISRLEDCERAQALHDEAHKLCFIANSVNFTVGVKGKVIADA